VTSPACRSVRKRATDLVLATLALVLAGPVLLLATAATAATLGRPCWFRQQRTGLGRQRFRLLKLRTMTDARDPAGELLPDAERLTRLGRVLRRWSVDELPGLLNVLRGQLSLVGPRPLLPRYDPWYTEREALRFTVRPGITGLAQIRGRNEATWDERLEWDARYVEDWSYALDLRILGRTLGKVVAGAGVVVDPRTLLRDLDDERSGAR
jgi:lipopolysaccharide/colanic/teichoic acid biosynthesis glycosyltransferase